MILSKTENQRRKGYDIVPKIMTPLIGEVKELKYVKDIVVKVAADHFEA